MKSGNLRLLLTVMMALALVLASDGTFARGGSKGGRVGIHAGTHFGKGSHFNRGHFSGFRSRTHIGFFVGAPLFAYGYTPYPGYAAVYSAPLAIEYVEKEPSERSPSDYWYYCPGSSTYYPYVKECPGGWQTIEPIAPQA